MYEKKLKFCIEYEDDSLVKALEQIPPLPEFSHEFRIGLLRAELGTAAFDVYLIDLHNTELIEAFKTHSKAPAKVILLSDSASEVPEEYWEFVDDVWVVTPKLYEVRRKFAALQQNYAVQRQRDLNANMMLSVIDASSAMIWFKDARGAHIEINKKFCDTVGKPRDVIRGKGHYFIWDISPEDYSKGEFVCQETDVEVMDKGVAGVFDENVLIKGGMRKFKTIKAPLFDDEHKIMGTVGIASDITDVLNLSIELRAMLDRFPFGVVLIDTDQVIRNVNDKLCKLLNIDRADAIGQQETFIKALFFNKGWRFQNSTLDLSALEDQSDEWYYEKNGQKQWITVTNEEMLDVFSKKIGNIILLEDVTKEHLNAEALFQQASTDLLTGLYNRRYFYKNVPILRQKSMSDSIIFIDLNRFKMLNDEYGHEAGDAALKTVAELMHEEFADHNAISIRQGGDEFVVYLSDLSLAKLTERAEHFQQAIKDEFDESEQMRTLQASVGVAYTENHLISLDELVSAADKSMYESKRSGGNIVKVTVLKKSRKNA
ncbi:MAG: diguanylate cyclase [Succinivibrio sp.]|nr:diguanylate cyclase [Succinivibrio sp.]